MLVALGGLACATNPATGERQLVLVPESQAKALGEESAQSVVQSIGLVDNAGLASYVSGIGQDLASRSERPDLGWKFQVLDDSSVNAFALPGGFIFVTRGILAHLGSEAQLATVVGHEIGHVTAKHSVNQMSKATLAQLGLGVGGLVSDTFKKYGQVAAAAGLGVLFLKYGRDDEYQADELGVRYAGRAGYDRDEMPKVFEVLDRVGKKAGSKLPEWLSTHPSPGNRIEHIRETIAKSDAPANGKVEREAYLSHIDGITYGPDPKKGYFVENRFIHPELGFEVTFPAGWKTANTNDAVMAKNEAGDAAVQLSLTDAKSADEALAAFLAKEGIQAGTRGAGASSTFEAKTDQGTLAGLVAFFDHGGRVYGLLGITKPEQLQAQLPVLEGVAQSFKAVADPALTDVAPMRLQIVKAPRAMTLAELVEGRAPGVSIDDIALLNGLEPQSRLEAGQLVKTVTPGKLPPGARHD